MTKDNRTNGISGNIKTLAALFVLVFVVLACFNLGAEPKWYSFNEGMAKGKADNKPVIVDFYADWCSWCKVMDKETFSNKEVAAIMNANYILVRIDVEGNQNIRYKNRDFTPKQFQMYMQVSGLPTIAFFDKKGELVTLLPGFVPARDFKPVLNYISTECYSKGVTYKDYVDSAFKCAKK